MPTSTSCAVLGGAILVLTALGCQTLRSSHAPAIALATPVHTTSAAPVARANTSMSIRSSRAANTPSLSVLSYNMQRTRDLDEINTVADHLETDLERLPDFILCQEVMFNRSSGAEYASSAEMLATRLGYFAEGSGRRTQSEGLAIVSKYPFEYFDARQLKDRSLFLGWPRVSVMGEFTVPGMGRVRVVDVHLTHKSGEHSLREKQLGETLDWMAARESLVHADITIIGGDFNARPKWREMDLIDGPRPAHGFAWVNHNSEEPTKMRGSVWMDRIDYIFAAAPNRTLLFKDETLLWPEGLPKANGRGTFMPSDHLLVLHEYAVGPREHIAAAE